MFEMLTITDKYNKETIPSENIASYVVLFCACSPFDSVFSVCFVTVMLRFHSFMYKTFQTLLK